MYASGYGFYIILPEELNETAHLLSEEQKKANRINFIPSTKKHFSHIEGENQSIPQYCFIQETEIDIDRFAVRCFTFVLSSTVQTRKVIIVYSAQDKRDLYGFSNKPKGVMFGFAYGTENKLGESSPQYKNDKGSNIEVGRYSSVNVIILDDTVENRSFLEDLYTKLQILSDKIMSITKSTETLLDIVSKNQKLLL